MFADLSTADAMMSTSKIKEQDPFSGSCVELQSSTPLECNYGRAVPLLWSMLLRREVFGPDTGLFKEKSKHLTENSAEVGYSVGFGILDDEFALDGVTFMAKYEEEQRTTLVWMSMLVPPSGKLFFRSQGWISVSRQPQNPQNASVVRICSQLSGDHFGVPGGNAAVDISKARKHQRLAKARIDRVQQRILERAEESTTEITRTE
ncbi:unnamed protein product [Phytophthora lilii]|uniref:Unnamed protein product n=1 Tax=Phytophthora lilii TaxID=2077276 RepID=A0A9W6TBJ0_9STRA|nr:unnamed protein product [Phytophthora lilii]